MIRAPACNITRRGRLTRLLVAAALFSVALLAPLGSIGFLVDIAAGAFVLFEVVAGWCVIVATLSRIYRGALSNRVVRMILGADTAKKS